MPTLSAVRASLWKYGSNVPYLTATDADKAEFDAKLNQVCDRYLKAGYSDKVAVALTAYLDACDTAYVTLPPELSAILGAVSSTNGCCGYPLTGRSEWYEYLPNSIGLGACTGSQFIAMPGRFTTFQDWNTPMRLRIKMEKAEAATFIFRGKLLGEKIYTDNGSEWIEGVELDYVAATVTTTQLFDEPPYLVIKPVTEGRVTLWVVDSDNVETQVATYEPYETVPHFKRYKVPVCDIDPSDLITPTSTTTLPSSVYSVADIDAMFGTGLTITVATTGTTDLAPTKSFFQWFQRIIAEDGVGNYTHKFTLDNAKAKSGAIFRVAIDLEASANQTINIYDDNIAGTLLETVTGDSSNARYYFFEARFNGATWEKINGLYIG